MTKHDALRAARALLDGMAGTTEGRWEKAGDTVIGDGSLVCTVWTYKDGDHADAAHIARSCPARLGPVLRALMEGD